MLTTQLTTLFKFLGPLIEIYGRSHVLQLSNLFYLGEHNFLSLAFHGLIDFLVWNLVCGFAQTKEQLIAFRFLAGLGGSAPLSVSMPRVLHTFRNRN